MDGHTPPGQGHNYYDQPWQPIEQESESLTLEFTNSQNQILEALISGEHLYPSQSVSTVEPFANSAFPSMNYAGEQNSVLPDPNPYQLQHAPFPGLDMQHSVSSDNPPAMESWRGIHNFSVEYSRAQDKTKATPWIYSSKLHKLFVQLDKVCPVSFKIDVPPNMYSNFQVRGQMVYSKPENFGEPVERCISHQQKDPTNNSASTKHVLRSEEHSACYHNHEDQRHSVVVPLKPPPPGSQLVTYCYRFMCLSSCSAGINRRFTKLIFTLETLNGEEVGRHAVDVRICSCPGRDIKNEEEKREDDFCPDSNSYAGSPDNTAGLIPIVIPSYTQLKKMKKRKQPQPPPQQLNGDNEEFFANIFLTGRANYDLFLNVMRFFTFAQVRESGALQPQLCDNEAPAKRLKKEHK